MIDYIFGKSVNISMMLNRSKFSFYNYKYISAIPSADWLAACNIQQTPLAVAAGNITLTFSEGAAHTQTP